MRWFQKNALSLVGVVLAAALTVGGWYVTTMPLFPAASTSDTPTLVDKDDVTTYHGYSISRFIAAREPAAEDFWEVPDGTQIIAAAVDLHIAPESRLPDPDDSDPTYTAPAIAPEHALPSCGMMLTEQDAPHRVWTPTTINLKLNRETDAGYPVVSSCTSLYYADTYRLMLGFLLPDDATGPFFFDISFYTFDDTPPISLRYDLDL